MDWFEFIGRVIVVSFGGGNDSTAALIKMVQCGFPAPHAILFADTGGEKPHTYVHIKKFSEWLQAHGYPPVTIVHTRNREKRIITLEETCRRLGVMPSVAYGRKTCSQRFKVEPQEKWMNADPACRAEWKAGRKIVKVIGYNYTEFGRARFYDQVKFENWYPLIETVPTKREQVEQTILTALGYLPGKSSCFFCPNSKKPEIIDLNTRYPDLAQRALAMEDDALASGKSKKVPGLGRRFSWREFLAGLVPPDNSDQEKEQVCGCYDG